MTARAFIGLMVLALGCTVFPWPQPGTRAQDQGQHHAAKRGAEQEVITLRRRVTRLEHRLARLEGCLSKLPADAAKPVGRVGEIKIVGNYRTAEGAILAQLPFRPGSMFSDGDLCLAERRLELLHLFVCDPERDIRPTVECISALNAPEGVKDILVKIQEKD